ncbi:MAG: hypothetical protein OCD76_24290 [Reichenbachiella sp.]
MFSEWGFSLKKERTLTTKSDWERHWWFNIFLKNRRRDTTNFPLTKDWQTIKEIRQYTIKKTWNIVIEEWQIESEQAAQRWLSIIIKTQRLDDHKPPRAYWIAGDKLYFIMTTAAQDWFAHSDELVQLFSGSNKRFLNLFNDPLDLATYKKGNAANGSTRQGEPYLLKPDTVGTYYDYFWFKKLRREYSAQQSFSGLNIRTYIYGLEIGTFEEVAEELIGVKSRLEDPLLRKLNLVGSGMTSRPHPVITRLHYITSIDCSAQTNYP